MRRGAAAALVLALGGCVPPALTPLRSDGAYPRTSNREIAYLGAETWLIDTDLVQIVARVAPGLPKDAEAYARCAVAQYTLVRGYAFARHVRTRLSLEGSVRAADAIYTISPALPRGTHTLDAEVIVAECRDRGIPTV